MAAASYQAGPAQVNCGIPPPGYNARMPAGRVRDIKGMAEAWGSPDRLPREETPAGEDPDMGGNA